MSGRVRIVEVGPRDGLQYEKVIVGVSDRRDFILRLAAAGLHDIEAGSFVHPKWVPQMAGTSELAAGFGDKPLEGVDLSYLVPNKKGMENALAAGVRNVSVFIAATENFSKKNINMTIEESLEAVADVVAVAKEKGVKVRGYISTIFRDIVEKGQDPRTGTPTPPRQVAKLAARLLAMGCYEVSLGDTTGVGTPEMTQALLDALEAERVPLNKVALHCHDTYGRALENIAAAYDRGVRVFDAAAGGLGGCPYAGDGASGNVATEKVVAFFEEKGVATGVNLPKLAEASRFIRAIVGQETAAGRRLG